ncbi:MAG: hypothetical protein KGI89_09755 [Euryarchaeota archaeon]|nr:hypothetical protein [Euryarchaeota archaeon]
MTATSSNVGGFERTEYHPHHHHFWIIPLLFGLFFLVPLAIWGVWVATGHVAMWGGAPFAPAGFFFFPFGFFLFVLLFFFVVRGAVWAGRGGWHRGYGHGPGWYGRTPKEVAGLRYARGEITPEQYREILRNLGEPLP